MTSDSIDRLAGFLYDHSVKKAMEITDYIVWVGAGFVPTLLALELSIGTGKLRAVRMQLAGLVKKPMRETEVSI
jgi:hypothetical protein